MVDPWRCTEPGREEDERRSKILEVLKRFVPGRFKFKMVRTSAF